MTIRNTLIFALLAGMGLVVAALTAEPKAESKAESKTESTTSPTAAQKTSASSNPGYSELPDGRGGINIESIVYTEAMDFDKALT